MQPVRFSTTCNPMTNVTAIAIGHGKTSDTSKVSRHLKYALLKVIPLNECAQFYADKVLSGSYICAKSTTDDYESVCGGDSGGPLINESDKTLIGVTAFVSKSAIHYSSIDFCSLFDLIEIIYI